MSITPKGEFVLDTDNAAYEQLTRRLGEEAAELFFAQLPPRLDKRAAAIAHLAMAMQLLDEGPHSIPTQAEAETAAVVPLAAHIHSSEAARSQVSAETTMPSVETKLEGLGEPAAERALEFLIAVTDSETVESLNLRQSDKKAAVEAVVAMLEPLDSRENPVVIRSILTHLYEGLKNGEIAHQIVFDTGKDEKITAGNVSVKLVDYRKRAIKRTAKREDGKTTTQILREHIENWRALIAGGKATEAQTGNPEPKPELEPAVESLLTFDELLAQTVEGDIAASITQLFEGDRYDSESMSVGRLYLHALTSSHMPSATEARELVGDAYDSENYKGLQLLAGIKTRQGELPQTLKSLARFRKSVDEATIRDYVYQMLNRENREPSLVTVQPKAEPQPQARPGSLLDDQAEKPRVVSEKAEQQPDLWNIVSGYEQASRSKIDEVISEMLDEAAANKQLTKTQALALQSELITGENILDTEDRKSMLDHLNRMFQAVFSRNYTRLHDFPEFTSAFVKYTKVSEKFGPSSIREIVDRLNETSPDGVRVSRQRIVLDIAAVLQVVLEESRHS